MDKQTVFEHLLEIIVGIEYSAVFPDQKMKF